MISKPDIPDMPRVLKQRDVAERSKATSSLPTDGCVLDFRDLDWRGVALWEEFKRAGRREDLLTSYRVTGSKNDLDDSEGISLHRAALALRPNGHPKRSMALYNMAVHFGRAISRQGNGRSWTKQSSMTAHHSLCVLLVIPSAPCLSTTRAMLFG